MNIIQKQIDKVEKDLHTLRMRWIKEVGNRKEIEKQADERKRFLETLKRSNAFYKGKI